MLLSYDDFGTRNHASLECHTFCILLGTRWFFARPAGNGLGVLPVLSKTLGHAIVTVPVAGPAVRQAAINSAGKTFVHAQPIFDRYM